jgi:hypothetical protein
MPASAGTGQRGAHDGALVKKEARGSYAVMAVRYPEKERVRRKLSERHALQLGMYTPSHSFVISSFYTFMYAPLLLVPSTSKHTPLPEGSTMAAPAPHLSKGKGKHERQNK